MIWEACPQCGNTDDGAVIQVCYICKKGNGPGRNEHIV
jgi:hypothetical protein